MQLVNRLTNKLNECCLEYVSIKTNDMLDEVKFACVELDLKKAGQAGHTCFQIFLEVENSKSKKRFPISTIFFLRKDSHVIDDRNKDENTVLIKEDCYDSYIEVLKDIYLNCILDEIDENAACKADKDFTTALG